MWRRYLFVAMGRNMLVFDLAKRFVRYDKELIREGREPVCQACNDGNGIRELLLDDDRLIVLPFRGTNTRVVDLPSMPPRSHRVIFF